MILNHATPTSISYSFLSITSTSTLLYNKYLMYTLVMRLSKPGFQIVPPLMCEKEDIPGDILSESSKEDGSIMEGFGMTSFLQLPTSFG